jgi:hypothetical protein
MVNKVEEEYEGKGREGKERIALFCCVCFSALEETNSSPVQSQDNLRSFSGHYHLDSMEEAPKK